MKNKLQKAQETVDKKSEYKKPSLKKFGDLTKITQAKGGTKNDGGGKPRSKINGGPA